MLGIPPEGWMPATGSGAYLFLELAFLSYMLGFCWEHFRGLNLRCKVVQHRIAALTCFWFAVDQVAVALGLWAFPEGGTLPVRILGLPLEEYLLFLLHSLLCLLLVSQYSYRR